MKKTGKLENEYQRKLIDLNRRIIKLEKLEIARQAAEMRLKEIEKRYRGHFEQSKDHMVLLQDRKVKYIAPPLARLLGYTMVQLLNSPFGIHIHPDELPRIAEYWVQRMAGKDVPPIYETVLKRRDGEGVRVEIKAGIVTYQGSPADLVIIRKLNEKPRKRKRQRKVGSGLGP